MTASPVTHAFSFVHHHHHQQHPLGCETKAPLRRKIFRKRTKSSSVSGGGGGDYYSDSDSTTVEQPFPTFDYSRNKRLLQDETFTLIMKAVEILDSNDADADDDEDKKEGCSSHDEVETIVGDEDDSSGDETIHSTSDAIEYVKEQSEEVAQLPQPQQSQQPQQPHAPPLSPASSFSSSSPSSAPEDNRTLRSEFISGLVDFADDLISSIWQKPASPSDIKPVSDSVIPMRQFIQEVLRRSQSSYGTLSLALYYLGRASRRPLPQHLRGKTEGEFPWCKCSRRMFLAALILATKFLHDRAYTNRAWAKLAGLSTREVGLCERALLDWLNWELYVHPRVFIKWQSDIFKRVRGNMSYLSSAEGCALLGLMNEGESSNSGSSSTGGEEEEDAADPSDKEEVCLQMMQVTIQERVPNPVPPKVNTTETYERRLLLLQQLQKLQQQQQQQQQGGSSAAIDAEIRNLLASMHPQYTHDMPKKRTMDMTSSCAQETQYEDVVQVAKRSRVV